MELKNEMIHKDTSTVYNNLLLKTVTKILLSLNGSNEDKQLLKYTVQPTIVCMHWFYYNLDFAFFDSWDHQLRTGSELHAGGGGN